MFSLYGYEANIRNVYAVSHQMMGGARIAHVDELRPFYLDLLESGQPHAPVNRSSDPFICDEAVERQLARAFGGSTLNDLHQDHTIGNSFPVNVKLEKVARARAALSDLLARDVKFRLIFELCVHSIFLSESKSGAEGRRGSHGGSSSAAVGSIWLSMGDKLTHLDIMEMFVHELTHHLVFIDELAHGHFNYDTIPLRQNFAYSAILNKSRPLDKVVHSIVVGTELLMARRSFLSDEGTRIVHPSSEKMTREVVLACDSVFELPNLDSLVTPRVCEIIERCRAVCTSYLAAQSPEQDHVAASA